VKFYANKRPEECLREALTVSNSSFYSCLRSCNILTVGDGDLSFSLALAKQLNGRSNLIATTHLSKAELHIAYGITKIDKTIESLNNLGVVVINSVDATNLHLNHEVRRFSYDRVIWNFPCIAGQTSRAADAQLEEIDMNKSLLVRFFKSVSNPGVLNLQGEVHISHKAKPPFSHWDIERCADVGGSNALRFQGAIVFDRSCFRGYEAKKVATGSGSFPTWDAKTYIWKIVDDQKKTSTLSKATVDPQTKVFDVGAHPLTAQILHELENRKGFSRRVKPYFFPSTINLMIGGGGLVVLDEEFLDSVSSSLMVHT
jgi:25S rRNA (uracil2634-N3)-methyltransferase